MYSFLLGILMFHTVNSRPATLPAVKLSEVMDMDFRLIAHARDVKDAAVIKMATRDADRAMSGGPYSVVHKTILPVSGDKHDYMSQAPYFWANPRTASGLPYIVKDGQVNPEISKMSDPGEMTRMITAVRELTLGYYFTGQEEYANRAAVLLRAWFLNPKTKMNPNMQYAQGIPGVATGKSYGVLEARDLPEVCDAASILHHSRSWSDADQQALKRWFKQYLQWLLTSQNAREEMAAPNNHGFWFDYQETGIALFVGSKDRAKSILQNAENRRLAAQVRPDGSMPQELARTRSFFYSTFNLEAMMRLANLAPAVGLDLWDYRAPDGASIGSALNYLAQYITRPGDWKYQNIEGLRTYQIYPLLLEGDVHLKKTGDLKGMSALKDGDRFDIVLYEEALRLHWLI